jgi:hypothetical protein
MERYRVTPERAQEILEITSARLGSRLRDVATYLAETGEEPLPMFDTGSGTG